MCILNFIGSRTTGSGAIPKAVPVILPKYYLRKYCKDERHLLQYKVSSSSATAQKLLEIKTNSTTRLAEDRNLAGLSSERLLQQLMETDAGNYSQPLD